MVRIRENPKLKTRDKIRMVMKTMPEMSTTGIAELLNISRQMVHKHQVEISRGNTSN
jgi:predicted ArsR family transcriptional regulator